MSSEILQPPWCLAPLPKKLPRDFPSVIWQLALAEMFSCLCITFVGTGFA